MARVVGVVSLAAFAAFVLVGCGPQYRTYTSYHPPGDNDGRQCVNTCLDRKSLCRR